MKTLRFIYKKLLYLTNRKSITNIDGDGDYHIDIGKLNKFGMFITRMYVRLPHPEINEDDLND